MAFSLFGTNPFVDPATGQNIFTNPTANGLLGGTNPYQDTRQYRCWLACCVRPAACAALSWLRLWQGSQLRQRTPRPGTAQRRTASGGAGERAGDEGQGIVDGGN